MIWAYITIPAILFVVGFVAWKMRQENKSLSKAQQDGIESRARFNQPDGANQGAPVRNLNGFNG